MTAGDPETFTDFACMLADAAREVTLLAASKVIAYENKSLAGDFDPVTAADLDAERAIRTLIETHYPDHGIAGEEFGDTSGSGRYSWSLDPIDGTRAWICGLPGWTTLIALLEHGEATVGLIDAPRLDERYLGFAGGARLIDARGVRPLSTSRCTALGEARLATTDPGLFAGEEAHRFAKMQRSVRLTRYGYDAYAYARLAAGYLDLVAESGLRPHDYHALLPVIRGAGGVVGNWEGGSDVSAGRILAAANLDLFEQATAALTP